MTNNYHYNSASRERPTLIEKLARAKEIYQIRQEGKTLQAIGNQYHLTRERVRQIINWYKQQNYDEENKENN